MQIRIIDDINFENADGITQMALDEAIFKEYDQNEKPLYPITLRFYYFNPPTVTFGYFQKYNSLNHDFINQKGFNIIRRITGGRAVLHLNDLTYSIIVHKSSGFYKDSILENYKIVAESLLLGLSKVSIIGEVHPLIKENNSKDKFSSPICFDAPSFLEIKVNNKKFCGSAQSKSNFAFLQHGTIFFEFDPKIHFLAMTPKDTLKHMDEDMINNSAQKLKESVINVSEINSKISFIDLKNALINGFQEKFQLPIIKANLLENEYKTFLELKENKYKTLKWNTLR